MDNLKDYKIAVIGAGIIGGAIADALAPYCQVMATRRSKEKLEEIKKKGIETTQDNIAAATWADVVVVAVKPKQVVPVLQEITSAVEDKLVISFAAAISLDIMRRVAPRSRFIRAMTNIAAIVRKGYTVYAYGGEVLQKDIALAEAIFANLGEARAVDEQFLDVLTAMSGSGPAYIYTVVESMIYGALRMGLPRDLALQAAAHTAIGASHLLLASGRHPAELRDLVVTPGGVTIEGIYELEESRIRTAFMKAISAASVKAQQFSEDARVQAEKTLGNISEGSD
ncbi:pyrroline-5-carboxylate reductase [Acetomicrobium sp. S15 = DSM 107314]|uniref:pyrroline-5-carboxylate reductase n=1 Tax=Acetomicrobium sp. S15 = DSM 107314 TaxID=2529858 RepID=UPI001E5EECEE|nr:pyrroline-5-carboxylate reductase [Acetomicrobium sp. S15 = DSM 107314]